VLGLLARHKGKILEEFRVQETSLEEIFQYFADVQEVEGARVVEVKASRGKSYQFRASSEFLPVIKNPKDRLVSAF